MLFHRFIKQIYFDACFLLGKQAKLVSRIKKHNYVPILNFHRVSPHANPYYDPLHPDVFRESLKNLQKDFNFVGLSEIHDVEQQPRSLPNMVVSFDDGYADFVEYALPILDELGIRANQNIIPHCIETGLPPWNVQIYDFLQQAPLSLINQMNIPQFDVTLDTEDFNAKAKFGLEITKFLNNRSKTKRLELFGYVEHTMENLDGLTFTPMMNLADCHEVTVKHDLGVHSYSHDAMALESDTFFRDDFRKCADFFRKTGLGEIEIYAFPYGSYSDEQIEFLLSNRVKKILLVEEKYAFECKHVFPRFTMYGKTANEITCRAIGLKSNGAL